MANIAAAAPASVPAAVAPGLAPVRASERIRSLDVLRGIALFGMILVHFMDEASVVTGIGRLFDGVVYWLVAGRAAGTFALLFGIGFALQLRRAEERGDHGFAAVFLRRMLVLVLIGVVAEIGFGYTVLVSYGVWGMPLLLVRRWSTRRLVWLAVIAAAATQLYVAVVSSSMWFALGPDAHAEWLQGKIAANRAHYDEWAIVRDQTSYFAVIDARLWHMAWSYTRPRFLVGGGLEMFVLGMLALRLGLLQRPREHTRVILALMAFGLACWTVDSLFYPLPRGWVPFSPLAGPISSTFGLIEGRWMVFTYVGGALLLFAHAPVWLDRLSGVGLAGRMALTNYLAQIIILELMFAPFALGLEIRAVLAPLGAVVMFGAMIACSRWWLARYRFGPVEWLWRSITYGRPQPMRVRSPAGSAATA